MKLGVFNPVLQDKTLEEACCILESKGVQMIEVGCGGYPGKSHCDPKVLLNDDAKLQEFLDTIKSHNLTISGFSCHGNPLHPNKEIAKQFDDDLTDAILMCEKTGVDVLNCFSGCPGDGPNAEKPNWVTCSWPTDFSEILKWQWEERLIPYWKEKVEFAKAHNLFKIALELHPGFCVYNTSSLLKLRKAVGSEIGANFDPSHLIWQGMDPVLCIRELGREGAIFHFHAKDTQIDVYNKALNGVLDIGSYEDQGGRAWRFRSVGCGNDLSFWKNIVSELRMVGYDHVMSIEHEDGLMSTEEGLNTAIRTLKEVMIFDPIGEMYWV